MKRADDMAARLPLLYREGELVLATLAQPAVQIIRAHSLRAGMLLPFRSNHL